MKPVRERPGLPNLHSAWRRHGLDADTVRPFAELVATLADRSRGGWRSRSTRSAMPEDAHAEADLLTAVERAAAGQRPFGLVSFGKAQTKAIFGSIRILDRPPDRSEDWGKFSKCLPGGARLRLRLLAGRRLRLSSRCRQSRNLRMMPRVLYSRCWQKWPSLPRRFSVTSRSSRREVGHLFPYGLSAAEIARNATMLGERQTLSARKCLATGSSALEPSSSLRSKGWLIVPVDLPRHSGIFIRFGGRS